MNPATKIEYNRVRCCNHCNEPTVERHENTVCLECQVNLEGETPVYMYECPVCKELIEEGEECPCEENANQYEPEED